MLITALRHGVQVLAFCCAVAAFTAVIWPAAGYGQHLLFSVCIGGVIWLVVELGRFLVPRRYCAPDRDNPRGWPSGWPAVLLTGIGIAAGYFGGTRLASSLLGETTPWSSQDMRITLTVTIAAGIAATYFFFSRSRQKALQSNVAAAERDAAQARLMLLQSQLEPHMLFNTLANLRALIAVDPAAAQAMLDRLNGYLRATLDASRATAHPLSTEFERLEDYLELMKVRMGPRLTYQLDLPAALRELPIPTLLLQPVVENAVRHGLEPNLTGGTIQVSACIADGALVLCVQDSGAGFDPEAALGAATHFGLQHVIERVQSSTGGRGRVDVRSEVGSGSAVHIRLPADWNRA